MKRNEFVKQFGKLLLSKNYQMEAVSISLYWDKLKSLPMLETMLEKAIVTTFHYKTFPEISQLIEMHNSILAYPKKQQDQKMLTHTPTNTNAHNKFLLCQDLMKFFGVDPVSASDAIDEGKINLMSTQKGEQMNILDDYQNHRKHKNIRKGLSKLIDGLDLKHLKLKGNLIESLRCDDIYPLRKFNCE